MVPWFDVLTRLGAALLAGGIVGMERSYHGRPAGFRTHALVALASSMLMLVTVYQSRWFPSGVPDSIRIDPTRMAQGIMTGIGFLGAGVIFKEGVAVRGLTTAASIWVTSALGILMGVGLFFAATASTLATLAVLTTFRWIERSVPAHVYAIHVVRFERGNVLPEEELLRMLEGHGFKVSELGYRLTDDGRAFEYRMSVRTTDEKNLTRLAETLKKLEPIREFQLSRLGD
jgi:putative Mg2+ transporter-C (MgtC) family protein